MVPPMSVTSSTSSAREIQQIQIKKSNDKLQYVEDMVNQKCQHRETHDACEKIFDLFDKSRFFARQAFPKSSAAEKRIVIRF